VFLKRIMVSFGVLLSLISLTGCYRAKAVFTVEEAGLNTANVRAEVVQGVEFDIFTSPDAALTFLADSYGPEWTFVNEQFSGDLAIRELSRRGNTPISFKDTRGNVIGFKYVKPEDSLTGRPEYLMTVNIDFPMPPSSSDLEFWDADVTILVPEGWEFDLRQRADAEVHGFDDRGGEFGWFNQVGKQKVVVALLPPFAMPEAEQPANQEQADGNLGIAQEPGRLGNPGGNATDGDVDVQSQSAQSEGSDKKVDENSISPTLPPESLEVGSIGKALTEISQTAGEIGIDGANWPAKTREGTIPVGVSVVVVEIAEGFAYVEAADSVVGTSNALLAAFIGATGLAIGIGIVLILVAKKKLSRRQETGMKAEK
jgi:hypothetical protein